jgi:hypothetical protein
MTRLEKCELLKSKGYTYDPDTGKVYGISGKEVGYKRKNGYIVISGSTHFKGNLYAHHFAWFWVYGNVEFYELDHININTLNNRICNLRISNRIQQNQNRKSKGYYWDKENNKWKSEIKVDVKRIHLGRFNTEEEARQAYIEAKEKYHII